MDTMSNRYTGETGHNVVEQANIFLAVSSTLSPFGSLRVPAYERPALARDHLYPHCNLDTVIYLYNKPTINRQFTRVVRHVSDKVVASLLSFLKWCRGHP